MHIQREKQKDFRIKTHIRDQEDLHGLPKKIVQKGEEDNGFTFTTYIERSKYNAAKEQ